MPINLYCQAHHVRKGGFANRGLGGMTRTVVGERNVPDEDWNPHKKGVNQEGHKKINSELCGSADLLLGFVKYTCVCECTGVQMHAK